MAALKSKYVHLERKTARSCETLVYGEEGWTKTKKSNSDIDLLPPAIEALVDQGNPLATDHMREVIWKPALEKAGMEYRSMMQTRQTYAAVSLSEGETHRMDSEYVGS